MKLEEASRFLQELCDTAVTLLPDGAAFALLQERYQFHPIQEYLSPGILSGFFAGNGQPVLKAVIDPFQIRFIFCTIDGVPVVFGPYCAEIFSVSDCAVMLRRLKVTEFSARELAVYRSRFPVMDEERARFCVLCLIKKIQTEAEPRLESVDYTAAAYQPLSQEFHYTPYIQLIQMRYAVEQQFMEHIAKGNSWEALKIWASLHKQMAYRKRQLGDTVESARFSATITRTVIRLAAYRAGLPADLLDQLTRESNDAISRLTTIEGIKQETYRLILQVCRIIRRQLDKQYSPLVLSALYSLENHYQEDVRIDELAEELSVSTNHLIARFREETGNTPAAYLIQYRLKMARNLLADSGKSIQEIAGLVGIPDANYFSRLFKRAYGETPSKYRRSLGE